MGKVRLLLVLPLLCLSLAQARADPGATPGLNRATAGGAACCSLTHYNKWEARQGRRALSEVRRRGNLPAPVLGELERNAWAKPFMPKAMMALRSLDKLPGTLDVVTRLARAHDEGGARGAAFEVFAGKAHLAIRFVPGRQDDLVVVPHQVFELYIPTQHDVAKEAKAGVCGGLLVGSDHLLDLLMVGGDPTSDQPEGRGQTVEEID